MNRNLREEYMEHELDTEEGLHKHCLICVNVRCRVRPYFAYACGMVLCPAGCGAKYHRCKQADHENLCPDEVVWCLNHWNGCSKRMARKKLKYHFPGCPARNEGYSDGVQFVTIVVSRGHSASAPSLLSGGSNTQEGSLNDTNALWVVPWQQIDFSLDCDEKLSHRSEESLIFVSASWHELSPTDAHALTPNNNKENMFRLELLPFVIQRRIIEYLDAPSLKSLSLVSHQMRTLCAHMLRDVGAVSLLWEKRGGKWVDAKRIWKF